MKKTKTGLHIQTRKNRIEVYTQKELEAKELKRALRVSMDLLQKQSYGLWYSYLIEKLIDWQEAKPNNKELKNCVKAITEIGILSSQLITEVEVLTKKVDHIRNEKNKEIQKLKQELKQYEI